MSIDVSKLKGRGTLLYVNHTLIFLWKKKSDSKTTPKPYQDVCLLGDSTGLRCPLLYQSPHIAAGIT